MIGHTCNVAAPAPRYASEPPTKQINFASCFPTRSRYPAALVLRSNCSLCVGTGFLTPS
ncbi:hypothetical protein IscW_ISCW012162 [Ixodes scapularis]|uniref:Uncharacterized protein n=1 Tax=Ixodes scapularis TaxID=6945 RepID=B7QFW4_IXOSC|nr:hypothetical protein IscW_ISCW012162 [Ixodes scapularis]|eukprot:XP_002401026.1 hypothetical protein IscW_ISCW012162 [Ixodes scapularis]